MTRTRLNRWLALGAALGTAAAGLACRAPGPGATRVSHLIDDLPRAERRSRMAPDRAFRVEEVVIDGVARRVIVADAPSRITWRLHVPAHATLRAFVALAPAAWDSQSDGVMFRVGMSDQRVYEPLAQVYVDPVHVPADRRWVAVTVDLSPYGGWHFSLFYRPDRITWDLVLATDGGRAGQGDSSFDQAIWAEPVIASPR